MKDTLFLVGALTSFGLAIIVYASYVYRRWLRHEESKEREKFKRIMSATYRRTW